MSTLLLEAAPNTVLGNIIVVSGAFIILLVLLRLFAWNAITSVFASRAKKISDDIDAAEANNKQAADLVKQNLQVQKKKLLTSFKLQTILPHKTVRKYLQQQMKKQLV